MGHYYALSATNNAAIWLVEKKNGQFCIQIWMKLTKVKFLYVLFFHFWLDLEKKQISNSENSRRVEYDNGFFY